METHKSCLVLSSKHPEHSAGLGRDLIKILQNIGYDVDFLTLYKSDKSQKGFLYVYDTSSSFLKKIKNHLKKIYNLTGICKLRGMIRKLMINKRKHKEEDIKICYPNENSPSVPVEDVIKNIKKNYKFIITLFWDPMLNTTTLRSIYSKFNIPIIIYGLDMAPMTGGCYYFRDCKRYQNGCGCCPALNSNDPCDQSFKNFNKKKDNYDNMNIWWLGNTYMNYHLLKTQLIPENHIFNVSLYMDESVFKPLDRVNLKRKHKIDDGSFIVLCQSSYMKRKGTNDVISALRKLDNHKHARNIEIISIGTDYLEEKMKGDGITVRNFGKVSADKLIELYNVAEVFLCGSLDDAGPSMVNQSILCGTPVVAYDSGTAMDVIVNGKSGFKGEKGDPDILFEGMKQIYSLSELDYLKLRESTRKIALELNSLKSGEKKFSRIIEVINTKI